MSLSDLQKLSKNTKDLYEHPYTVSVATRDILINVASMRLHMAQLINAEDLEEVSKLQTIEGNLQQKVYELFDIVSEQFLGDKKYIDSTINSFNAWNDFRKYNIELVKSGQKELAKTRYREKGGELTDAFFNNINYLIEYANNKGIEFNNRSSVQESTTVKRLTIQLTIISLLGLLIAYFISKNIKDSIAKISASTKKMSFGDNSERLNINTTDEIGELATAYNFMQDNIKKIVIHANKVADGDYSGTIEPRSSKDELAISLNKMTSSLNKMNIDDH